MLFIEKGIVSKGETHIEQEQAQPVPLQPEHIEPNYLPLPPQVVHFEGGFTTITFPEPRQTGHGPVSYRPDPWQKPHIYGLDPDAPTIPPW